MTVPREACASSSPVNIHISSAEQSLSSHHSYGIHLHTQAYFLNRQLGEIITESQNFCSNGGLLKPARQRIMQKICAGKKINN